MKKGFVVFVVVSLLALAFASAVYAGGDDTRRADGPRVSWGAADETRVPGPKPPVDNTRICLHYENGLQIVIDCPPEQPHVTPTPEPRAAQVWACVDGIGDDCPTAEPRTP